MSDALSYRALHALAAREARRVELGHALDSVRRATHVVVALRGKRMIYAYSDAKTCASFAIGLDRDVRVERMTEMDRERLTAGLAAQVQR